MREYKIDLLTEIDSMTWRKFLVLLNNLSPDSVLVAKNDMRGKGEIAVDVNKRQANQMLNSW